MHYSVSCVLKADAEKKFGVKIPGSTDIFLKGIAGGFVFIIDAVNKKMLYKLSGKVK